MARRSNDSGFRAMMRNLKENDGLAIQAGIFKEAKASRSANGSRADNLAYRLKIHDQGLGNNPKREVLKPAKELTEEYADQLITVHVKNLTKYKALDTRAIGRKFVKNIKEQFPKTSPPKTEATIKAAQRKYGGNRKTKNLIQTRDMINAIKYRVNISGCCLNVPNNVLSSPDFNACS